MSATVSKVLVILAGFLVLGLLVPGCDNPFADDEDDGILTVSVSDYERSCSGSALFAAFVFNAGADVDSAEPVAIVGEEVADGAAAGTAFVWGDDARPTWIGKGGNRYDVYPTIYCPDGSTEDGIPAVGDQPFYETTPELVYRSADFDQPVTYKKDGNKSIATAFGEYE